MREFWRLVPLWIVAIIVGCFVGWNLPAHAHDTWWNGREVDPVTKRLCCGDNDIKHLTREEVAVTAGGYRLSDTGETVPYAQTQPSPDGEFWVFRWGSPIKTQCFFAPVGAT